MTGVEDAEFVVQYVSLASLDREIFWMNLLVVDQFGQEVGADPAPTGHDKRWLHLTTLKELGVIANLQKKESCEMETLAISNQTTQTTIIVGDLWNTEFDTFLVNPRAKAVIPTLSIAP